MTVKFEQELATSQGSTPPKWTSEATYYFENEHGEQWIAKCDGEKLMIAGLDIGWKEIILNHSQVLDYLEFQKEANLATSDKKLIALIEKWKESENPLSNWIFNTGEKYGLLAVLHSSKLRMEFHNPNPQ
ncbi:hypothetical protein [Neobacillus sp. NPDC093127]|uniref:hypothetical protein n=1 Tax=Neobacillus sp. NPDC093127 TaxID=3364296 RepID=UPI00380571A2